MRRTGIAAAAAAWMLAACAQPVVTDERGRPIGIEYHTARPYVLVPAPSGNPQTLATTAADKMVVVLPDLARPQYAVPRSGWGKLAYNIDCSAPGNGPFTGTLKSFQIKDSTDSQISSIFTTVGSVATSIIGGLIVRDQIRDLDD